MRIFDLGTWCSCFSIKKKNNHLKLFCLSYGKALQKGTGKRKLLAISKDYWKLVVGRKEYNGRTQTGTWFGNLYPEPACAQVAKEARGAWSVPAIAAGPGKWSPWWGLTSNPGLICELKYSLTCKNSVMLPSECWFVRPCTGLSFHSKGLRSRQNPTL